MYTTLLFYNKQG